MKITTDHISTAVAWMIAVAIIGLMIYYIPWFLFGLCVGINLPNIQSWLEDDDND